jgi:hypothetical protein
MHRILPEFLILSMVMLPLTFIFAFDKQNILLMELFMQDTEYLFLSQKLKLKAANKFYIINVNSNF